jgi:hypothetical protein
MNAAPPGYLVAAYLKAYFRFLQKCGKGGRERLGTGCAHLAMELSEINET